MHLGRACAVVALTFVIPASGSSLGPGFSYQGRLDDGGLPANGTYDFTFTLWDAAGAGNPPVGGSMLGAAVAKPGTSVTDGLFTVRINESGEFGPSAFTGDARWLQVAVNGTALGPRQPLTAAPYALFALDSPGSAGLWEANGTDIYNLNSGSVGIGTSAPQADLHIDGELSSLPGLHVHHPGSSTGDVLIGSPAGSVGLTGFANNGNRRDIRFTDGGVGIFTRNSPSAPISGNGLFVDESGKVGVGTTTPAVKFHVQSDDGVNAVQGIVTNGGRAAFFQNTNAASGLTAVRVDTNSTNSSVAAIAGVNTGSGRGGHFEISNAANGSPAVFATTNGTGPGLRVQVGADTLDVQENAINTDGDGFFGDPLYLNDASSNSVLIGFGGGNCGVGGATSGLPLVKLHVDGGTDASPTNVTGGYFLIGAANGANIVMDNNEIMARNDSTPATLYLNNEGGDVRIGQNGTTTSTVFVPVLAITGADLAEKFPISDALDAAVPGTVMEIDPDSPGKLRVARGAYSRRVAGVVSGAGDIPLGAVLGNLPGYEDAPPIALSGRVWVQCDATSGPINPGDLLTTADQPGHAMRVADHARAQGAILGKAMSALPTGEGLVLVLVSLQ